MYFKLSPCARLHHHVPSPGGEDAYFALDQDLGVFDGVGAWAAKGHDPGVFTRGFAAAVAGMGLCFTQLAVHTKQ